MKNKQRKTKLKVGMIKGLKYCDSMITIIHKHVSWHIGKFCQAVAEDILLDATKE